MSVQGTEEWRRARLGKLTASRLSDVLSRTKAGYGASRGNYMAELLVERLTGQATEGFTNAAMERGVELEAEARAAYAWATDHKVDEVGFVNHPEIPMCGASPDGLVGLYGLVEIKCPNTATHLESLLRDEAPSKYRAQMQWQMACTKRTWCDFASYDPRLPEPMRLFVKRVMLDPLWVEDAASEAIAFLSELKMKEAQLRAKFMLEAA